MLRRTKSAKQKYRAHLPAPRIPDAEHLFFHSIVDFCDVKSVNVSTDSKNKAKVNPMISMKPPRCIADTHQKYYENAIEMATCGNSLVCVLKDSGVYQSTLYSCPVFKDKDLIVGVLIAVEANTVEDSPSPTSSSMSSQEKGMIDTLCQNSMAITALN